MQDIDEKFTIEKKPQERNNSEGEISTTTLIILFIIAVALIAIPYFLLHKGRSIILDTDIEKINISKELQGEGSTQTENAPSKFKDCIDYVDIGNQESELMHQGLGEWENVDHNNKMSYGGPSNKGTSSETWRNIMDWAGVILAVPSRKENKNLTLKINVWGDSFRISEELGGEYIQPNHVFISYNGYYWIPIGKFTISGKNAYETYNFKFNSSIIKDKLYVKILVPKVKRNNKEYGLTVNWICVE